MISNRRGFLTLADHSLKVCRRNQMSMSFIFFDLNQFKIINDEHGHHEGDFVLATFAEIMLNSFRDCDLIARLGGDEFVAMLSDSDSDSDANYSGKADIALERFAGAIDQANKTLNKPYTIEYSAGVSYFKHDTDKSIETMLKEADTAMYKQKKTNAL